jgi:hypothetical protein
MSRIRFRLDEFNLVPKLLLTCNPDNGWMFHEYYMPWKENTLSNRVKFVRALPGDNPKLPKSYLEELDNLDPVSRMRLRDGIWEYDNDPTALITYDDIRFLFNNYRILLTNESNDIVATRTAEKDYNDAWITVDVARKGKDSTCVIRWVGLAAVEIHLFKKETTDVTSQFVNDMMMVHGIPARNVIVDAGGVGGGFCDQVKGCREFVFNGTPIHRDNYKYIKDQMYFALANEVTKRNMFVKLPDGEMKTWLMDELAQVKQDNFGKEGKLSVVPKDEVKKKLNGRSPDIADALMLRMLPIVEKRKPFRRADTIAIIEW